MYRTTRNTIIGLVIVFGGLFAYNQVRSYITAGYLKHYAAPAQIIATNKVKSRKWSNYLSTVGHFEAIHHVTINAQTSGMVTDFYFHSGQWVKAGTLLVQLDDRLEQAQSRIDDAALSLAKINYQRQRALLKKAATSQSNVDEAQAKAKQAKATLDQTQVSIRQKKIIAPFDGQLGLRQVEKGQYVTPGTSTLTSLQSLDPIHLEFYVPEQNLAKLSLGQAITARIEAYPKEIIQGKISAIDPEIDIQTHNLTIQAVLRNPNHHFYPGMFATLHVILPTDKHVLTVPATAINYALYGDSIFVVKSDGKDASGHPILRAYHRSIKVGQQRGEEIAILKGIKKGEEVVVDGQIKLVNKARVSIENTPPKPS